MTFAPWCHIYFHRFRNRPLVVTTLGRTFHWRWIYGLQLGPYFIGAIKGSRAASEDR